MKEIKFLLTIVASVVGGLVGYHFAGWNPPTVDDIVFIVVGVFMGAVIGKIILEMADE